MYHTFQMLSPQTLSCDLMLLKIGTDSDAVECIPRQCLPNGNDFFTMDGVSEFGLSLKLSTVKEVLSLSTHHMLFEVFVDNIAKDRFILTIHAGQTSVRHTMKKTIPWASTTHKSPGRIMVRAYFVSCPVLTANTKGSFSINQKRLFLLQGKEPASIIYAHYASSTRINEIYTNDNRLSSVSPEMIQIAPWVGPVPHVCYCQRPHISCQRYTPCQRPQIGNVSVDLFPSIPGMFSALPNTPDKPITNVYTQPTKESKGPPSFCAQAVSTRLSFSEAAATLANLSNNKSIKRTAPDFINSSQHPSKVLKTSLLCTINTNSCISV